jgi:ATP-dependent Clp protease ATP-binding subunit ClpC
VFNPLEKPDIVKILDIQIQKMLKRIVDLGYNVQLSDAAKEFIAEKGYDSAFGARPLYRAMQKYLEDPLAEEILKGEIIEGAQITVDIDADNHCLKVQNSAPKKGRKPKS